MDGELEQLGERIAEQAAHLDAAMHRLLGDLREFDARGGWRVQGAASCAHWLAWRVGWDPVTARDHVRVARKLAEFALIDDALRRGEVSYSKVRALLRVATPANEALLLDHARLMTASQLEKLCRKYALAQRHGEDDHPQVDEQRRHVRRRDLEDGMVKIEAVLHPEEAELVWTMLDHAASRLAREAAAAAATGEMVGRDSAESAGSAGAGSRDVEPADRGDAELGDMESTGSIDAGSRDTEALGRGGTESRGTESVHSDEGRPGWLDDASHGLLGSRASLAGAPVPHRIGPGAHGADALCANVLETADPVVITLEGQLGFGHDAEHVCQEVRWCSSARGHCVRGPGGCTLGRSGEGHLPRTSEAAGLHG